MNEKLLLKLKETYTLTTAKPEEAPVQHAVKQKKKFSMVLPPSVRVKKDIPIRTKKSKPVVKKKISSENQIKNKFLRLLAGGSSTDKLSKLDSKRKKKGVEELMEMITREAAEVNSTVSITECDEKKKTCPKKKPDKLQKLLPGETQPISIFPHMSNKNNAFKDKIEFTVDQPGRVSVRLEYLMGTKMVSLNDMSYNHRLRLAIAKEQEKILAKMNKLREEKERTRVERLVLAGKIDPPPGMEHLSKHPIFKVNKLLGKIENLGDRSEAHGEKEIIHGLVPVEPFEQDRSGKYFRLLHEGAQWERISESGDQVKPKNSKVKRKGNSTEKPVKNRRYNSVTSSSNLASSLGDSYGSSSSKEKGLNDVDLWEKKEESVEVKPPEPVFPEAQWKSIQSSLRVAGEEGEPGDGFSDAPAGGSIQVSVTNLDALLKSQHQHTDLKFKLSSYVSYENAFVSKYIDDAQDAREMFQNADEVCDVYTRENLVADDFVKALHKLISGGTGPTTGASTNKAD